MMMEQKLDAYVDVSGGDGVEVADVELSQGVLTVIMPQKKGVFVVNKQSPNRCVRSRHGDTHTRARISLSAYLMDPPRETE